LTVIIELAIPLSLNLLENGMPLGLISTQDQIAAFREASPAGVALVHVDTCLSSYLQDHHNRDGEALFGVHVDGNSTVADVKWALANEVASTGDRVPNPISDAMISAAIGSAFDSVDPTKLFDASLEVPELDDDGEPIEDDCGEMCQAWFVLSWDVPEEA
jgi:hypothetical protein